MIEIYCAPVVVSENDENGDCGAPEVIEVGVRMTKIQTGVVPWFTEVVNWFILSIKPKCLGVHFHSQDCIRKHKQIKNQSKAAHLGDGISDGR